MTRILLLVWTVILLFGAGGCSSTEPYQNPRLSQSDIVGQWALVRVETWEYYGNRGEPDVEDKAIPDEILVIDASTFTEYLLNGNCYLSDSYDYELTSDNRLTNDSGDFDFTEDLGDGVTQEQHTAVTIDRERLAIRTVTTVSAPIQNDWIVEELRFYEPHDQTIPPAQWPDVACD